ncbi:MAG TPA: hypothetical protein PK640_09075 [Verrucomicrobiota bacterium]|nr:hypothetical protein [Verrucomicrobiota bacterium]
MKQDECFMNRQASPDAGFPHRWLNRMVLGIGLPSLFSDWSHEIATTVMPSLLATMGVAAAWLGLIEGVSNGLSSFAKGVLSAASGESPFPDALCPQRASEQRQ